MVPRGGEGATTCHRALAYSGLTARRSRSASGGTSSQSGRSDESDGGSSVREPASAEQGPRGAREVAREEHARAAPALVGARDELLVLGDRRGAEELLESALRARRDDLPERLGQAGGAGVDAPAHLRRPERGAHGLDERPPLGRREPEAKDVVRERGRHAAPEREAKLRRLLADVACEDDRRRREERDVRDGRPGGRARHEERDARRVERRASRPRRGARSPTTGPGTTRSTPVMP